MFQFVKKHRKYLILTISMLILSGIIFARPLTFLALDFYDAYITPYNGQCAYRVVTGGPSCSEYFRHEVEEHGVLQALSHMPTQFKRCQKAMHEYQHHTSASTPACSAVAACCADTAFAPID